MKPASSMSTLGALPSAHRVLSPLAGILLASAIVYGSAAFSPWVGFSFVNAVMPPFAEITRLPENAAGFTCRTMSCARSK